MKRGLHRPTFVPMWQLGLGIRYDEIRSAWGVVYCASIFLPGVSIVFSYSP
jgi:hypothetical protein